MRFKFSIKQLFLLCIFAAPVWGIVFVAIQGRLWGIGALYGMVIVSAALLLMLTFFLVSDRLAALLYRRRQRRIMSKKMPVSVTPAVGASLSGVGGPTVEKDGEDAS